MIIHSLSAENLLKYRRITLENLPTHGVIAISGGNESGKSSIGEAICFALFGRTFAVGPEDAQKLIRWGENRCSVTIKMSVQSGARYQLSRYLDRDGNQSARLCRADDPEHPLARGLDPVAGAVRDLLGYDFEAFIDSFYLAQREIITPHPHSQAVRMMAGIAPMVACREELCLELERDQAALAEPATRTAELEAQLVELAFDGQRPHVLAADQADLTAREQLIWARRQALTAAAADYQGREPQLRRAAGNARMAGFLRLLSLLGATATLGLWAWLTQPASSPLALELLTLIEARMPLSGLLYGGLACAGLFVLFWGRILILSRRVRALHKSGVRLGAELAELDELEIGLPEALRLPPTGTDADGRGAPQGRLAPEQRAQLIDHLQTGHASVAEVHSAVSREIAWLDQARGRLIQRLADLKQEIRRERERRQEHDRLSGLRADLQREEAGRHHRIRLRAYASELLDGATRHLSHTFNHLLRDRVGRTLPMFTEGRYQHLQVDEDLTVRAFSNEKHDFMGLDEISSGTQRQIMLALRLSLSQQLINRAVQGNQFIFLDEPFAFFDDARTRNALAVLPRLSDNITQIWIVAQQFPPDLVFERSIECQREGDHCRDGDTQ